MKLQRYLAESPHRHLSPGQIVVLRHGGIVSTVLGSCVAVTMFHRRSGLAAMCHAMLAAPLPVAAGTEDGDERRFRFMTVALPSMIDLFERTGADSTDTEVKIFGGANVIRGAGPGDAMGIGQANLDVTRTLLEAAGLKVAAQNTGGRLGRKVVFNASTGEVLHKFLGHRVP